VVLHRTIAELEKSIRRKETLMSLILIQTIVQAVSSTLAWAINTLSGINCPAR
jgi:hypothetical protein